jgi:hypothetical protein
VAPPAFKGQLSADYPLCIGRCRKSHRDAAGYISPCCSLGSGSFSGCSSPRSNSQPNRFIVHVDRQTRSAGERDLSS